jgi:hypothetical protein
MGFKAVAFLPLGMTHAEMCDLLFGSFLLPASDLQDIANEPEDALVQIHSSYKNMKTVLVVAPMTVEQAARQLCPRLGSRLQNRLRASTSQPFDGGKQRASSQVSPDWWSTPNGTTLRPGRFLSFSR